MTKKKAMQTTNDTTVAKTKAVSMEREPLTVDLSNPLGTVDYLSSVPYQDLKTVFTSLGVPDAWRAGVKSKTMIADALEKLAVINDLKNKGLEGEALASAVKSKNTENKNKTKEMAQIEQKENKEEQEAKENKYKEYINSLSLSKEEIQNLIDNANANLKVGIPAQRDTLLYKRKVLLELLE